MLSKDSCGKMAEVAAMNFADPVKMLNDIGITFQRKDELTISSVFIDGVSISQKQIIQAVQNVIRADKKVDDIGIREAVVQAVKRLILAIYDYEQSDRMFRRAWDLLIMQTAAKAQTDHNQRDHLEILKNTYRYHNARGNAL